MRANGTERMACKWSSFVVAVTAALHVTLSAIDPCSSYQGNIIATCGQLMDAGNVADAVNFANDLVKSLPNCVDSFQCAGIVAYMNGELSTSIVAFEKAASLNPRSAAVLANLGLARQKAGYLEGAKNAYEAALTLDPTAISVALSLCEAYDELELDGAATRLRLQLLDSITSLPVAHRKALVDEEADVRRGLALAFTNSGNISAAERVLRDGLVVDPRLVILHALVHIPHVPVSLQEIVDSRGKTMAALDAVLISRQPRLPPGEAIEVIGDMGYYLTYNGMNDEEFRRKIAAVHGVVYPHLTQFTPPAIPFGRDLRNDAVGILAVPPRLPRRIRVGFVMAHFHMHSVSKMISRLILTLPKLLFEVILFYFPGPRDFVTEMLQSQVETLQALQSGRSKAAADFNLRMLTSAHLDVLVYPELGMYYPSYLLAFRRIAPVQVTTHGNSETSGLADSIDYFVSFDGIEHPTGQAHYSEQLIRLEGFHSQFLPPMHLASPGHNAILPHTVQSSHGYSRFASHNDAASSHVQGENMLNGKTAAEILAPLWEKCGVPPPAGDAGSTSTSCEFHPVYLCPQTLYKLHPWFDAVITEILLQDPCGKVVFLHGNVESWDVIVVQRLANQLSAGLGRSSLNSTMFSHPQREVCEALRQLQPLLRRVVIAPQRGNNAFLEMLAAADVIVDTFPFGGCTSSYEALSQGTPVVSTPTDALRGRFTYAMLRQFGLGNFIAPKLSMLAGVAVEVANYVASLNVTDRRTLQNDIATRVRGQGIGSETSVHEWTRFLLRAVSAQWRWMDDDFTQTV